MGHGHAVENHHQHNGNRHSKAPAPLTPPTGTVGARALALAALLLPPVLYVLSLSFTLKTLYSTDYSLSPLYNSSGLPNGLHLLSSPFYSCTGSGNGDDAIDNPADFNYTCTRRPYLRAKGTQACLIAEDTGSYPPLQYCQKSVTTAELYVAGAVLVGIALLAAAIKAALYFPYALAKDAPDSEESSASRAPPSALYSGAATVVAILTPLLGLLAALCLVSAQAVGISAHVTDRRPTAAETPRGFQGRWIMGTPALVYSSVAWLSAILGWHFTGI